MTCHNAIKQRKKKELIQDVFFTFHAFVGGQTIMVTRQRLSLTLAPAARAAKRAPVCTIQLILDPNA